MLLGALSELRALAEEDGAALDSTVQEDLRRLFQAAASLEAQLTTPAAGSLHDQMNSLAAIRGYAEMLQEDTAADTTGLGDSQRCCHPAGTTATHHGR